TLWDDAVESAARPTPGGNGGASRVSTPAPRRSSRRPKGRNCERTAPPPESSLRRELRATSATTARLAPSGCGVRGSPPWAPLSYHRLAVHTPERRDRPGQSQMAPERC